MSEIKPNVLRNRYVYTMKFTYTDVVNNMTDGPTNAIAEKISQHGGKVINFNHVVIGGNMTTPIYLLSFIHYEAVSPIIL